MQISTAAAVNRRRKNKTEEGGGRREEQKRQDSAALVGSLRPAASGEGLHAEVARSERRLAYDSHELLLADLVVLVLVCFPDHLHELLVGHLLAQLLGHGLQVLKGDLARRPLEELEGLLDLLLRVLLAHFGSHDLQKLVEVQITLAGLAAALVEVRNQLLQLLLLRLEAEGAQGHLELLRVDCAGAIGVKEVKRLLDLGLLLVLELCPVPRAGLGPSLWRHLPPLLR